MVFLVTIGLKKIIDDKIRENLYRLASTRYEDLTRKLGFEESVLHDEVAKFFKLEEENQSRWLEDGEETKDGKVMSRLKAKLMRLPKLWMLMAKVGPIPTDSTKTQNAKPYQDHFHF
ncbi:hypothetical protein Tco_1188321 [Tanacetum coccineum]